MIIRLNGMTFYGFHGVQPEERVLGQRFEVDAEIYTLDADDPQVIHLEDTVDYTKIYDEIKHIMEVKQFPLLENCANEILDALLASHQKISKLLIRIVKPNVPIKGNLRSVSVEMTRCRK